MKTSKLRKIYTFLNHVSPYLKLILVRWVYNKYATKNTSEKNAFMNYGYHDDTPLSLSHQDEPNRLFIQLYHHVVQSIDLQGKDLIEVGCGQGAGGVFLLQYKKPRSYIGLDLSEKAIELCQRHNAFTNAQWMQGYADKLPIPDNSVDVVINIESSHCYPSMEKFIREVQRVLRPNGYMAFADLRHHSQVNNLDQCLRASGLRVLHKSDITPHVLEALTRISDRRKAHINATYPRVLRQAAREQSAVKGSPIYNDFINGQRKYLCYVLQKQHI